MGYVSCLGKHLGDPFLKSLGTFWYTLAVVVAILEPRGTTRNHLGPTVVSGANTPEQNQCFWITFWKVFFILFATVGGIWSMLLSDVVFDDML